MKQSISILLLSTLLVGTHAGVLGNVPVLAYIDAVADWWGCNVPAGLGLPKATPSGPNVVALSYWLSTGPADAAGLWADLPSYIPANCGYGTTNSQMQQALVQKLHNAGIKLIVSAFFDASESPTSKDPTQVCTSLAQFVLNNHFDGVDLDYEDTESFVNGLGANWLITCTKVLRQTLPQGKYILTHAPSAPYFTTLNLYSDGAYLTIDKQVGQLIDWYNIQYYDEGANVYTTYQDTFVSNDLPGTAVLQLNGLKSKVAVGKPVTTADALYGGWVAASTLAGWLQEANKQNGWCGGAMYWEEPSDSNGAFGAAMKNALSTFPKNCTSSF